LPTGKGAAAYEKETMKKNLILLLSAITLVFSSCSTDYEILKSYEAIILTADSSTKVIGQDITFTVKDSEGNDLTADATIYVDGVALEGNTFTSATVGSFQVTAKYFTVISDPLMVNFHDGSEINFRKRMLIEDYTGTWCGYCPRVAWGIELVHEQNEDAVAVAIHRPSSNIASPVYDPYNFDASELENTLSAEGYPKGFLNRMTQWNFPEPENLNLVFGLTPVKNQNRGLAITWSFQNGTINLDVNVMFSKNFSNNLKLVVYVVENGLIYDQHNYTTYFDGEDILVNYVHNHVLRACLTPILGEAIAGSETTSGNVFTRSFSVGMPTSVSNPANVEFVAFVIDENGNVVNVRKTGPGEIQDFEQL
jgi:thiol-disulfide isomerase/thioredoxin